MSVASSSTASSSSTVDLTKPGCFVVPSHVIPPVDYDDDPDSGTGDSDGEIRCKRFFFQLVFHLTSPLVLLFLHTHLIYVLTNFGD